MKRASTLLLQLIVLALPLFGFVLIGCAHVRPVAAVSIEALALAGDIRSTDRAIQRGASEGNPLLRHHRKAIMITISIPAFYGTARVCGAKESPARCFFITSLYSLPHAFAWWHNERIARSDEKR